MAHILTHRLSLFHSHSHTLDCKNFWTAQMYCIQMHFQLVALKLEALSPRLTLSRSKSLAKIAKFCFSIRTSSTSHTLKKLRTKKSTCKSLAQSPKLCSALLEIELDCVTGGSLPSLFLPLLPCKCSFHFPSVTHSMSAISAWRVFLTPWSCNCRQANCQSD